MMSRCASEGCALDSRGCVSLDKILRSFGAPISEEQAWAICYALAECYIRLCDRRRRKLILVSNLKHVILHKDGYIDDETFLPTADKAKGRHRVSTEGKLVADLGVVLYRALEYSLRSDEERELSPALDRLIDHMTSAEPEKGETDDEGIERDSGDSSDEPNAETTFTMKEALGMCEERLVSGGTTEGFDEHYKAVVRALIAEAVDLTSFLKKVAAGTRLVVTQSDLLSSEQDLHQLQCEDWARLWKQVMKELREGLKLKKVDYTKTPLEYALTPYEMLMEDIRSRRYTLNKVMVNGDIPPRLKKDAHTIILDFIRSRPPLKKASDRKLAPFRKVSSPMELLMDSIKRNDHRLKHVATPVRARPISLMVPLAPVTAPSPQPKKKLIAAPRFNLSAEDDDDLSDIPPSSPRPESPPFYNGTLAMTTHTHASLTTSPTTPSSPLSDPSIASPLSRVAYDLAKYGGGKIPERRHSISICETPAGEMPIGSSGTPTPQNISGMSSNRGSPPATPRHQMLSSTSKTQRDFLSSAHFSSRLDCLSLTLEEVVHIRNVLTKADLEALPLDLSIKEDVAKSKICFLCMKTRFGFFSPRGRECRLCRRIVCKKCVTKMRIPTEHFSNIPVVMLTPQSISPKDEDEEHTSFPRTFLNILQFKMGTHWFKKSRVPSYYRDAPEDLPKWKTLPPKRNALYFNLLDAESGSEPDLPRGGSIERQFSMTGSVGSAPASPSSPRSFQGPSPLQVAPCITHDIQKNLEEVARLYGKKPLRRSNTLSTIREVPSFSKFYHCIEERHEVKRPLARSHSCRYAVTNRKSPMPKEFGSFSPSPEQPRLANHSFCPRKQELRQRNMEISERLRGQLMAVCLDCKAMVIHVLLSIKLRKDNIETGMAASGSVMNAVPASSSDLSSDGLPRSHLHLNLTPVYN